MSAFKQYRRSQIAELRPYVPGEQCPHVSISMADLEAGSPKLGDMIARNPKNHYDQWIVLAKDFADNFEPIAAQHPKGADQAQEIKRLRNALKPFADCVVHLHPLHDPEAETLDGVKVREWRAAYEAYNGLRPKEGRDVDPNRLCAQ